MTIEGTDKEIAAFLFMAEKRPDKRMTDKAHGDVLSAMVEYSAGAISSEEYRDRLAAVLKQDCSWQSCQTQQK